MKQLTDAELWQAIKEAEQRKSDFALPINARVMSHQTYTMCLQEARRRGFNYVTLRSKEQS